jgi:large subunit ribosomal protein L25
VYGGSSGVTTLIKLQQKDAANLLKEKSKGSRMMLEIDGAEENVLFKNYSMDAVSGRVEHVEFLRLVAGEAAEGMAHIVLKNKDMVIYQIQHMINSIPHRAIPSQLVDTIEIDLAGMKLGDVLYVKDLDIAKNPNVKLLVDEDDMVLNIVESKVMLRAAREDAAAESVTAASPAE